MTAPTPSVDHTTSSAPDETSSGDTLCETTAEPTPETTAEPETTQPPEPETTEPVHTHTPEPISAIAPTCTETGMTEGVCCTSCGAIMTPPVRIPATGHTAIPLSGTPATCTAPGLSDGTHCVVCEAVLVAQVTIPATGHTETAFLPVLPTLTEDGQTGGTHCAVCQVTITAPVRRLSFDHCHGDYGYTSFEQMEKGAAMRALYEEIDAVAADFHANATFHADDCVVARFDFAALGLVPKEAHAVWAMYKADHPLYYWISTSLSYTGTHLYLLTDSDYADGGERARLNGMLYDAILSMTVEDSSPYLLALAYHDAIIECADYAYQEDGVTPEDAPWAHNILGVLTKKAGVCESYARAFQLFLNYGNVENIFVFGWAAGGNHAWNMAQMDDGAWYWFDLTWDDIPTFAWGVTYAYFCVNDTENVLWRDGGWTFDGTAGFIDRHTPTPSTDPAESGINFQYALPARSPQPFEATAVMQIGDTFSIDGYTCRVVGYRSINITAIDHAGAVVLPSQIVYRDIPYTVISLGDATGGEMALITKSVTEITIPASVRFMWDGALGENFRKNSLLDIFSKGQLAAIHVHPDNPYFASREGVLFTASLYTLIQYPLARPEETYTIPDETREIAYGAFRSLRYLRQLTLGPRVENCGRMNFGEGYIDAAVPQWQGGRLRSDELTRIRSALVRDKLLLVHADNPYYTVIDGVVSKLETAA